MFNLHLLTPLITASVDKPNLACPNVCGDLSAVWRIYWSFSTRWHEDFHFFLLISYCPLIEASLDTIISNVLANYKCLTKFVVFMLPAIDRPHIDTEGIGKLLIGSA